jgi:hypothetical protein
MLRHEKEIVEAWCQPRYTLLKKNKQRGASWLASKKQQTHPPHILATLIEEVILELTNSNLSRNCYGPAADWESKGFATRDPLRPVGSLFGLLLSRQRF